LLRRRAGLIPRSGFCSVFPCGLSVAEGRPKGSRMRGWLGAVSRRVAYAILGGFLALGAPTGLLVVRAARARPLSPAWVVAEVSADLSTYLYLLVSTLVAFGLFGATLGRKADQVAALSTTDALTGLATRRVFEERLTQEFARARRYGLPLSLLLIDVDELKRINDRHGHAAGDAALRRVAGALARTLRSTDLGARWGGDEFVFLAPNSPGPAAFRMAERLRREIEEPSGEGGAWATVSSGVATLDAPSPFGDESALLAAADSALYQAKRLGRNRTEVWAPDSGGEPEPRDGSARDRPGSA
jgi:diguanylate cyclase (GGDEF)-like protein